MSKRKWIVAVIAGAVAVMAVRARQLLARWASNPDPVGGQAIRFPEGRHRTVILPDGAEIATVTAGEGPTIVCVHGLTGSRHDWGPIAAGLLDAGFQVVAVEQRGHGDSTPGVAGYGSAQLGADLGLVLSELDIRAVALMGHSMGGMAAMAYAVDQPVELRARCSTLILIATAASLTLRGSALAFRLSGLPLPQRLIPSDKRLRLGTGVTVFGQDPSMHLIDSAIRSARRLPEPVRAGATAALSNHDLKQRVAEIDVPTLVIGGSRDRLIWPKWVRELASSIPNAELHMLEGAGHMVIWERHTVIVDLVRQFVASQDADVGSFPASGTKA